jgi:hypothetical protein
MAATQLGTGGLPTTYPNETIEWVRGVGETPGFEYKGERTVIRAKFDELKNDQSVSQLTYANREGRATIIGRFVRTDPDGGSNDGVTLVEELLAVTEVREIYAAPLFAALADDARACASHLANASILTNRMVSAMLALDDDQLTAWLNSQPPQDTTALFTAHGLLGEAINGAAQVAQSVLSESGVAVSIPPVDVRSVAEKLADHGRVFAFEDGVFSVTTISVPEPEPQPEPEPA